MPTPRTPLVAGNWKMHKTVGEALALVREMLPGLRPLSGVERVICPPFTALAPVADLVQGSGVHLGAQNAFWEDQGAYTGEISPLMLKDYCRYVIVGHSERRQYFGETEETVNRRVRAVLRHGMSPILCVGERLEEREAGRTQQVVMEQLLGGLQGLSLDDGRRLVIAYEPVWAIGTGHAASPADATEVVEGTIRPVLAGLFGEGVARSIRVLYGGSVKPENAAAFFAEEGIDGALVGGASLQAESFVAIAAAAQPEG